jgi:hypothetical protein
MKSRTEKALNILGLKVVFLNSRRETAEGSNP